MGICGWCTEEGEGFQPSCNDDAGIILYFSQVVCKRARMQMTGNMNPHSMCMKHMKQNDNRQLPVVLPSRHDAYDGHGEHYYDYNHGQAYKEPAPYAPAPPSYSPPAPVYAY